jgi:hypothetical protein
MDSTIVLAVLAKATDSSEFYCIAKLDNFKLYMCIGDCPFSLHYATQCILIVL